MQIRLEHREGFTVYGYGVETELRLNDYDLRALWAKHKSQLLFLANKPLSLYGVMHYTKNHHYYYLLGLLVEQDTIEQESLIHMDIPAALFAVATVPEGMTEAEAWAQFSDVELPAMGYAPDDAHGKYFEFYDPKENCELWMPVKRL